MTLVDAIAWAVMLCALAAVCMGIRAWFETRGIRSQIERERQAIADAHRRFAAAIARRQLADMAEEQARRQMPEFPRSPTPDPTPKRGTEQ